MNRRNWIKIICITFTSVISQLGFADPTIIKGRNNKTNSLSNNSSDDSLSTKGSQQVNINNITSKIFDQLSTPYGFKYIGECPDIDTLRQIEPNFDFQKIKIRGYYSNTNVGGGYFVHNASDALSADNGGTIIVTLNNKRWVRINYLDSAVIHAVEFGVVPSYTIDSSAAMLRAIAEGERIVEHSNAKRIAIKIPSRLKTSSTMKIDPSKVFLEAESGVSEWIIDGSNGYIDNYAFLFTSDLLSKGTEGDTPYVNTCVYAASFIVFVEMSGDKLTRNINFMKWFATLNGQSGRADLVSQCGMHKIRTRGFKDVLTNGDNGWGLIFQECGFDEFDRLAYLSHGINNSERIEFNSSVAQNGRKGIVIDNWTGGLIWNGGSIDYILEGEIENIGGSVTIINAHIEAQNRKFPICKASTAPKGQGAVTTLRDCTIVTLRQNSNTVFFFENDKNMSTILDGNRFTCDEGTLAETKNTKMCNQFGVVWRNNHIFSGVHGKKPLFTYGMINSPAISLCSYNLIGLNKENLVISYLSDSLVITSKSKNKDNKLLQLQCPFRENYNYVYISALLRLTQSSLSLPENCIVDAYASMRSSNGRLLEKICNPLIFGNSTQKEIILFPENYNTLQYKGYDCILFVFDFSSLVGSDEVIVSHAGAITF
jgi:hypothetical protein